VARARGEAAEPRAGLLRRWLGWRRPRSFRQKLALSIAVAALLTAFIEGTLDAFFDAQVARFQQANTDLLSQESATIALFLDFDGDEVRLSEEALDRLEPDTRFRLLQGGEVVLTGPDPFPEDNNAWAVREGFVGGDYRLEIARPTSPAERLVLNELFLDALDLPLFFLLALIVAWLLSRFALRPVRELTLASRAMAQQVSPTPIEVPPGDDELSEMARSFNLMQVSVQRLLERERAFTRYASHELRTPLSTFKVQLEALELGLSPAEQVLPVLERNVARMEAVLAALLALARSGERNPERAALEPLLRDLIGSLLPEARARLSYRPALGERTQVADAHLIVQAVQNLLENALRYSSGEVIFRAEAVRTPAGAQVRFTVRDFGPGVPEEALATLTKPFYRRSEHRDSLGLGLALVENISRSLSGTLELKNVSPGLEACLTLPLHEV
jgi:signal transduction histidine kinase